MKQRQPETGTMASSTATLSVEESLTAANAYSITEVTDTPSVSISLGYFSTPTVASDVSSTYASETSTPTPTTVPAAYLGWYSEPEGHRALTGAQEFYGQGFLTDVESCQTACAGFAYFGVEYSEECYCGDELNEGSYKQPGDTPDETDCNLPCLNNPDEYCGGDGLLDLYHVGPLPAPTSTIATSGGATSSLLASLTEAATTTSCIPYPTVAGQPCRTNSDCGDYAFCPLAKRKRNLDGPDGHCIIDTDHFTFCTTPMPSASTSLVSQTPSNTDPPVVSPTAITIQSDTVDATSAQATATSTACASQPNYLSTICDDGENCCEGSICDRSGLSDFGFSSGILG